MDLLLIKGDNFLLLLIVVVCLVLAAVLIIVEIRLKKKVGKETSKKDFRMRIISELAHKLAKADKSHRQEIDIISDVAKDFFNKAFNLNSRDSYYELKEEFKKQGKNEYATFCDFMLNAYYVQNTLTNTRIKTLRDMLVSLIKKDYHKNFPEEKAGKKSWIEEKIESFVEKREAKKLEKMRIKKQMEKKDFDEKIKKIKEKNRLIEKARAYATEARKRGFNKESVIKKFMEKGWSHEDIERVMEKVN